MWESSFQDCSRPEKIVLETKTQPSAMIPSLIRYRDYKALFDQKVSFHR